MLWTVCDPGATFNGSGGLAHIAGKRRQQRALPAADSPNYGDELSMADGEIDGFESEGCQCVIVFCIFRVYLVGFLPLSCFSSAFVLPEGRSPSA